MLKYKSNSDVIEEGIYFDPYIPLTLHLKKGNINFRSLYWRSGNLIDSLIEFEIDSESGELLSITLVTYSKLIMRAPIFKVDQAKISQGIPVFDIEKWSETGYKDEIREFQVYEASDAITVTFLEQEAIQNIVQNNSIEFRFTKDGFLHSLTVLTSTKLSEFL